MGHIQKRERVTLDDSRHSIKIQYFQGPRYQIALQLFASVNNAKEEIFPGNNFELLHAKSRTVISYIISWLFAGLIILYDHLFLLALKRKKERKMK